MKLLLYSRFERKVTAYLTGYLNYYISSPPMNKNVSYENNEDDIGVWT